MQQDEPVVSTQKEKALHKWKAHGGCRRKGEICLCTLSDQPCQGEPEPLAPVSTWLNVAHSAAWVTRVTIVVRLVVRQTLGCVSEVVSAMLCYIRVVRITDHR